MAIVFTTPVHGLLRIAAQMMTNQLAADDGVWVDFRQIANFNIHITGVSSPDVVQIRVSNELTIPANSAHGRPLGFDITAEYMEIQRGSLYSWVKVYKPTGTGSATDAYMLGDWIPLL